MDDMWVVNLGMVDMRVINMRMIVAGVVELMIGELEMVGLVEVVGEGLFKGEVEVVDEDYLMKVEVVDEDCSMNVHARFGTHHWLGFNH